MKRQYLQWWVGVALLLASSLLYVGCESEDTDQNITATSFSVDRDLTSYSGTDVYDWNTTLTHAKFEIHIRDFHAGDAAVRVYDANGKLLLYTVLVTANYTIYTGDNEFVKIGQTDIGAPGHWSVQLSYNEFSGEQKVTMN